MREKKTLLLTNVHVLCVLANKTRKKNLRLSIWLDVRGLSKAGLRFYKIQLYTVIILQTQLYTAQLDTPQLDTTNPDMP